MSELTSSITILTCADRGTKAAKKFFINEEGKVDKKSYSAGKLFYHEEKSISDLSELADTLESLRDEPTKFVIRDRIKENMPDVVQRKTHEPNAAFDIVSRPYVMLDIDKLSCPDFFDPNQNPEEIIRWVQNVLPAAFQDVSCYYKFSSSQNVYPADVGKKTISIHIWYYCNRAVHSDERKRFFRAWGGPVDTALFNAVQIHYIADPVFEGMDNPLKKGVGYIEEITMLSKFPKFQRRQKGKQHNAQLMV